MKKLGLVLLSGLVLTGCQSKEEKIEELTDEAYDVVGEIFDVLDKTNSPSNEKKYNDLVSNLDNINKKCKKLDVDYCVENIFTDWDYTLALTLEVCLQVALAEVVKVQQTILKSQNQQSKKINTAMVIFL